MDDDQIPLTEPMSMMPSSLSSESSSAPPVPSCSSSSTTVPNLNPPPINPTPPPQQQQPPPDNMIIDLPSSRVKRFVFRSRKRLIHSNTGGALGVTVTTSSNGTNNSTEFDTIEVLVPERIQASYGLYVWPSAPILAWFLWEHREYLVGKKVLELGAGTALPGIVAARCGAQVTLTDSAKLTHCLDQCRRTADVNGVGDKVKVVGLTWGLFLNTLTELKGEVDLLLGSDCFYDPAVFEDLISTAAYILEHNPKAKFLATYQERSSDWSIEHLLVKWSLKCKHVPLNELANSNQIDLLSLMQDHTIHLLEITRNNP